MKHDRWLAARPGRRQLAVALGVGTSSVWLAASVAPNAGAVRAPEIPDWVQAYQAPGWSLLETREDGKTLMVVPARDVPICVDVAASAQEQADAVTVSLRGDISGCHFPLELATEIAVARIRLKEPLAGRELMSADRSPLQRTAPIGTLDNRRAAPPGLVGLRLDVVRETVRAWDLKLDVIGPTSKRTYVRSQSSARKVKRGDVISVRTIKYRP